MKSQGVVVEMDAKSVQDAIEKTMKAVQAVFDLVYDQAQESGGVLLGGALCLACMNEKGEVIAFGNSASMSQVSPALVAKLREVAGQIEDLEKGDGKSSVMSGKRAEA